MTDRAKLVLWGTVGVVAAVVLVFVATSCGGVSVDQIGQHKEYVIHENIDGRNIACVEVRTDHGAGITCDWGR